MGGGEVAMMAATKLLPALMGGGGGAAPQPAAAGMPTPWDTTAPKPPMAPPAPGGGLLGGAQALKGGIPLPGKNPMFHDEPGGAAEQFRGKLPGGLFSGAPSVPGVMEELADKPLRGGQDMPKPGRQAMPVTDNNASARAQGWKTETIEGDDITGATTGAPYGDMTARKSRAGAPAAPVKQSSLFGGTPLAGDPGDDNLEPVQAVTNQASPKLDGTLATTMFGGPGGAGGPAATGVPGAKTAEKPGGLFGIKIPGVSEINDKLKGGGTNPLFQVGMGLLASGHDGSNPFTQMNRGISNIPNQESTIGGERRAESEEARTLQKFQEMLRLMAAEEAASGAGGQQSRVASQAAKVVR